MMAFIPPLAGNTYIHLPILIVVISLVYSGDRALYRAAGPTFSKKRFAGASASWAFSAA